MSSNKTVQNVGSSPILFATSLASKITIGIIDKLFTGPLWRLIENTDSILSLNPFLFRLKMKLSEFCNDATNLRVGSTIFNESDIEHHTGVIW